MGMIVIRSRTKEKISGTFCFEWSVHTYKRDCYGDLLIISRLVDRHKAQEVINRLGLVESHHTKDGEIYDTPDGAFKALFPYGLRNKFDIEQIEKTDRI